MSQMNAHQRAPIFEETLNIQVDEGWKKLVGWVKTGLSSRIPSYLCNDTLSILYMVVQMESVQKLSMGLSFPLSNGTAWTP